MFRVSDNHQRRHRKISNFLATDPEIAVILGVIEFEWTVRRAILAMGKSPTKEINDRFEKEKIGGLSALNECWKKEVKPRTKNGLCEYLQKDLPQIKKAIALRNKIVHGMQGKASGNYAANSVTSLIKASKDIAALTENMDSSVYRNIPRRIKSR